MHVYGVEMLYAAVVDGYVDWQTAIVEAVLRASLSGDTAMHFRGHERCVSALANLIHLDEPFPGVRLRLRPPLLPALRRLRHRRPSRAGLLQLRLVLSKTRRVWRRPVEPLPAQRQGPADDGDAHLRRVGPEPEAVGGGRPGRTPPAGGHEGWQAEEVPSVSLTIRFLAVCRECGDERLAVRIVAAGRTTGMSGLPQSEDWKSRNAKEMRAAIDYLERKRV